MSALTYYLTVKFTAPGVRDQKWEFDSEEKRKSAISAIKSANKNGIKNIETREGRKND